MSFDYGYVNPMERIAGVGGQTWYGWEFTSTDTFGRTTAERLDHYSLRPRMPSPRHICFLWVRVVCQPIAPLSVCEMKRFLSATAFYRRIPWAASSTLHREISIFSLSLCLEKLCAENPARLIHWHHFRNSGAKDQLRMFQPLQCPYCVRKAFPTRHSYVIPCILGAPHLSSKFVTS